MYTSLVFSFFSCVNRTLLPIITIFSHREIKQKNEGGWEFYWDEETRPGMVVLEVRVQKFLDSSLIDVDVHPTYVSMVIKSKVSYFLCTLFITVRVDAWLSLLTKI